MGRYETSAQICNSGWTKSDYAVIVSGENFPDALSGTAYAALNSSPVFLVSPNLGSNTKSFIATKLVNVNETNVLGGEGVVSQSILDSLTNSASNPSVSPAEDSDNVQDDAIDLNNSQNDNTDMSGTDYNLTDSELK